MAQDPLIRFGARGAAATLLAMVLVSADAVSTETEAGACSCIGPTISLVTPDRVDDAPLDTKVRVEVPSHTAMASTGTLILRAHVDGTTIATTSRAISPGGSLSLVELSPSGPLAPKTQYEVAMVDPGKVPSTTVIGTFRTGATTDAAAPRLDSMGPAVAYMNPNPMGAACQVGGPWVTVDGLSAVDPGRAEAQLVYGVWLGDAAGNIDTKRAPTAIARAREGRLHVGQSSLCDPRGFPIPRAPSMWLGIAAIDEAGNKSAPRRVRVDLARARRP